MLRIAMLTMTIGLLMSVHGQMRAEGLPRTWQADQSREQ